MQAEETHLPHPPQFLSIGESAGWVNLGPAISPVQTEACVGTRAFVANQPTVLREPGCRAAAKSMRRPDGCSSMNRGEQELPLPWIGSPELASVLKIPSRLWLRSW